MMSYLSEVEILDYLMTSDFNEGLTQEETKFLLLKFRYHYRVMSARNESQKWTISTKEEEISDIKKEVQDLKEKINSLQNELQAEENRQLTWKERLKGKKIKDNNGLK